MSVSFRDINSLQLPVPLLSALVKSGFRTVRDVTEISPVELASGEFIGIFYVYVGQVLILILMH